MKIALAQINVIIADFEGNFNKITSAIKEAEDNEYDLIVFPELAIGGYPPHDLLEYDSYIVRCEADIQKLLQLSNDIGIIIGTPIRNSTGIGKMLFNGAYLLDKGKISGTYYKGLLPTYDIFDERRYFEPASDYSCIIFRDKKIALTICEDIWNVNSRLYPTCPMDVLIKEEPDLMINIAASPFSHEQQADRIEVLSANAKKYKLPLYYVNHIGAQTEWLFDGGSCVIMPEGSISHTHYFSEKIIFTDKPNQGQIIAPKYENIYSSLKMGIKDYFFKSKFKNAVVGLSGGIDSAVVYVLACQALGADNVLAVLLPSPYTSDLSNNVAIELVNHLKGNYISLPIEGMMNAFQSELEPFFQGKSEDLTEENLQSRIRGTALMAISNKLGYIVLNTSNKSEFAVGYSTLYGDSIGAISIMGDLYKTEVYALSKYINARFFSIIPEIIITRAPSAELRHNQTDQDSLPDYETLDGILYQFIEERKNTDEIIALGYDNAVVERVIRLVNNNEFKRFQVPPILRVSHKAFGLSRRMPIVRG